MLELLPRNTKASRIIFDSKVSRVHKGRDKLPYTTLLLIYDCMIVIYDIAFET